MAILFVPLAADTQDHEIMFNFSKNKMITYTYTSYLRYNCNSFNIVIRKKHIQRNKNSLGIRHAGVTK